MGAQSTTLIWTAAFLAAFAANLPAAISESARRMWQSFEEFTRTPAFWWFACAELLLCLLFIWARERSSVRVFINAP